MAPNHFFHHPQMVIVVFAGHFQVVQLQKAVAALGPVALLADVFVDFAVHLQDVLFGFLARLDVDGG